LGVKELKMNTITNDKYVNFLIENYDDITALNEIVEKAKEKLKEIIDNKFKNTLKDLEQISFDMFVNVKEKWWCDKNFYDEDKNVGLFLKCKLDLDTIFSESDPDDASYLSLEIDMMGINKNKKKKYFDEWIDHFKAHKSEINENKIIFKNPKIDETIILKYPLNKEVNMQTILNNEMFDKNIHDAVKKFTLTVINILRKKN
jgi:hypothetical protein